MAVRQRRRRYDSEAEEWHFHLMKGDDKQFEQWRFIDSINNYNNLIEQFQKMYDETPASDRFMRAEIQSGIAG
jgi:hypothetical protein